MRYMLKHQEMAKDRKVFRGKREVLERKIFKVILERLGHKEKLEQQDCKEFRGK